MSKFHSLNPFKSRVSVSLWWKLTFVFLFVSFVRAASPSKTNVSFPSLIVCGKDKDVVYHESKSGIDWDYTVDGPIKDIQPQPNNGYFLVTGGSKKVFLLRKVSKGCRVIWDWSEMTDVSIESAVAADWDLEGNPALILAADSKTNRLFLAEAKSSDVKMRWEYKLTAAPRRVHICPDSGNFLVILRDSSVEEIQFQENKIAWALGKINGLKDVRDAVKDPWAKTYLADIGKGSVVCLSAGGERLWETHLPFAPDAMEDMTLSIYRQGNRRMVLAAARFYGARNVLYLVNCETGNVVAYKDKPSKGAYPSFFKAVPDQAAYYRKQ